jgi:hypothetical protein
VLGIAEHDNGWWEWEADPDVTEADGLPAGLRELLQSPQSGMARWRLGVDRFAAQHPYASLLISTHAAWLYRIRVEPKTDPAFLHPLFWNRDSSALYSGPAEEEERFLAELNEREAELIAGLEADSETARWVASEHLNPHVRLLQVLDAVSLALCSALVPPRSGEARGLGEDELDLLDVPRRDWGDRVTVTLEPAGSRRVVMDPYPFDVSPLEVAVPARVIDSSQAPPAKFPGWWRSFPVRLLKFEIARAA